MVALYCIFAMASMQCHASLTLEVIFSTLVVEGGDDGAELAVFALNAGDGLVGPVVGFELGQHFQDRGADVEPSGSSGAF